MKILLVDDHVLFRQGLASLLETQPDLNVIGNASNVAEAVTLARKLRPDLILMDFGLPDGTGLDATRAILAEQPEMKIVFMTVHDDDDRLVAAVRSGARGYLHKSVPVEELFGFIRGVARGEAAITPAMVGRLFDKLSLAEQRRPVPDTLLATLTPRELDVLHEIETGATNRQIAQRLVISERTVKNHVSHILAKLNLKSRVEVAAYARRIGRSDSSPGSDGKGTRF